jgi:hypothetical protein
LARPSRDVSTSSVIEVPPRGTQEAIEASSGPDFVWNMTPQTEKIVFAQRLVTTKGVL